MFLHTDLLSFPPQEKEKWLLVSIRQQYILILVIM